MIDIFLICFEGSLRDDADNQWQHHSCSYLYAQLLLATSGMQNVESGWGKKKKRLGDIISLTEEFYYILFNWRIR